MKDFRPTSETIQIRGARTFRLPVLVGEAVQRVAPEHHAGKGEPVAGVVPAEITEVDAALEPEEPGSRLHPPDRRCGGRRGMVRLMTVGRTLGKPNRLLRRAEAPR